MDTARMMHYLAALEVNNNRTWFHAEKAWYDEAKATFEALVCALMEAVRSFDPDMPMLPAKTLTFKLMRDTRFSHDKRPYNAAFRAHIGREGKKPIPCEYYVSLAPGGRSFLGGGLFAAMFPDATRRIRDAIATQGEAFLDIAQALPWPIQGEALQRVPRGYDAALPQAEYLKHKSWYVEAPIPDALVYTPEAFVAEAGQAFARMKPLNDFLNAALAGFELPIR